MAAKVLNGKNYKTAEFAWFHPTKEPKAILVLVPGSNSDGRDMIYWKHFRDFAKDNNVSLLACNYQDIDPSQIESYADAKGGSGQTLLDEISREDLTNSTKNALHALPILIWGFSAGGQFSYEMACFAPYRVEAFIVNKGGFYYTALAPESTRNTPSLWFIGNQDAHFRQAIIVGLYAMNKRAGAIWELVEEHCKHDVGDSIGISLEFFKGILEKLNS